MTGQPNQTLVRNGCCCCLKNSERLKILIEIMMKQPQKSGKWNVAGAIYRRSNKHAVVSLSLNMTDCPPGFRTFSATEPDHAAWYSLHTECVIRRSRDTGKGQPVGTQGDPLRELRLESPDRESRQAKRQYTAGLTRRGESSQEEAKEWKSLNWEILSYPL